MCNFFHSPFHALRRVLPSWRTLRLPALLSLLWCLLLLLLYQWTARREDEYAYGLARSQTATLYATIVAARAWNAAHGGVWIEDSERYPANPWIPQAEQSTFTEGGRKLVLVNPAYMTRQLADYSYLSPAKFRIAGLTPIRPGNLADPWESDALEAFAGGAPEAFALVGGGKDARFRYMAPLNADNSCLSCHQDSKVGDLVGGISVSIPAAPIFETSAARKRTTGFAYSLIGFIGMLGIGGATLQINRKKEQAEAANNMKSAFLANMSHDMRTPLTGILGMAELLEREMPDRRRRYLLSNLRKASASLLDVVDNIMRFSLLEAEGRPPQPGPFSLREELDVCLDTLRPACWTKGIELLLEIAPDVPDQLFGEAFRLRQALGNLLGNAVKFTAQGTVLLRVSADKSDAPDEKNAASCLLCFRVSDTGKGISPAEYNRIFENFVQGEAAYTSAHTGVGLGLAIARNIARRLGGDITLSSEVGRGSEFILTARFKTCFPAGSAHATNESFPPCRAHPPCEPQTPAGAVPSEEARVPNLAGYRVVIVEDTPVTALFLREALARAGAETWLADSGQNAPAVLRSATPDIALLDVRMPGKGGLELLADIRQGVVEGVPPQLPVLLLSATRTEEQERLAERLGVNGQLMKPIGVETLLHAVHAALPPRSSARTHGDAPNAEASRTGNAAPSHAPLAHFMHNTLSDQRTEQRAEAILDLAGAMDALDGDRRLWKRLCALFLQESGQRRAETTELADSLLATDGPVSEAVQALRRLAHRLKNDASTLHLPALRAACAALEDAAEKAMQEAGRGTDSRMEPEALREGLRSGTLRVAAALDAACAALRENSDGE